MREGHNQVRNKPKKVIVEAAQNEKKESVSGEYWYRGPESWDSGSKSLRKVKQTSGILEI